MEFKEGMEVEITGKNYSGDTRWVGKRGVVMRVDIKDKTLCVKCTDDGLTPWFSFEHVRPAAPKVLEVDLHTYGPLLFGKVVEQTSRNFVVERVVEGLTWCVQADKKPEFFYRSIHPNRAVFCVRGHDKDKDDNVVSCNCGTPEKAAEAKRIFLELVAEINAKGAKNTMDDVRRAVEKHAGKPVTVTVECSGAAETFRL